jgi:hypothetical protein
MAKNCAKCGTGNPDKNKFCSQCGSSLPESVSEAKPTAEDSESVRLKKMWKGGEISHEEYRERLLRLKLRDNFGIVFDEEE